MLPIHHKNLYPVSVFVCGCECLCVVCVRHRVEAEIAWAQERIHHCGSILSVLCSVLYQVSIKTCHCLRQRNSERQGYVYWSLHHRPLMRMCMSVCVCVCNLYP